MAGFMFLDTTPNPEMKTAQQVDNRPSADRIFQAKPLVGHAYPYPAGELRWQAGVVLLLVQ
jgi:hypothetical protein